MRRPRRILLGILWSSVASVAYPAHEAAAPVAPPNILLIVADDLGYSDLGFYGGEIDTPNLDALARRGAAFSQFYTASSCSPTRAMLLTGVDHHRVGFGMLAEVRQSVHQHAPGYEGELDPRAPTLAERLRKRGYYTVMAGKWHLGDTGASTPVARGFDHSYSIAHGASSHFDDRGYMPSVPKVEHREDGARVAVGADFYSSDFFVARIMRYLDEPAAQGRPFFAYLALTAPHYPLHAPRNLIDKYQARYAKGWDVVQRQRVRRLQSVGLLGRDRIAAQRAANIPRWLALSTDVRRFEAHRMAIYAAMIERLDQDVGQLLQHLNDGGRLANTLVVFMSDNGAEATELDTMPALKTWYDKEFDNSFDTLGSAGSFVALGPAWAGVAATPFAGFKGLTQEGGIRAPLIVAGPGVLRGWRTQSVNVADLSATLLADAGIELANAVASVPGELPLDGQSFLGLLRHANQLPAQGQLFFETYGAAAVIDSGRWKALRLGPPWSDGQWRLYDLRTDPAELHDLSAAERPRLTGLIAAYSSYAKRVGVVPPEREPVLPWGYSNRYRRYQQPQ